MISAGVPGGRNKIFASGLPRGAMVARVMLNGFDVTDDGFDVNGAITGIEVAAAHQPGAERREVVGGHHLVGRERRLPRRRRALEQELDAGMPVQRRDHGACGAHHTGHLLQRFVEPIDQERTRWTVIDERNAGRGADVVFHVDGARQLDLQAQKP